MNIYRRYFKIETGPIVEEIKKANEVNKKAFKEYRKVLKDIEAKPGCYLSKNRIVGVEFYGEIDRYLYKKAHKGWMPKKNSIRAKAIHERMENVKTVDTNILILKSIGLHEDSNIVSKGRVYWDQTHVIMFENPAIFVIIPWYDEDPQVLDEYKKDESSFVATYEKLLYKPLPEMVEVKEWQYKKAIDEWNESIDK